MSGKDVLLVIVIPLILTELGLWCGWFAGKPLPRAAQLRYGRVDRAAIRAEEWLSDLDSIPGQLSKLVYAVGQLVVGSVNEALRKIKQKIPGNQRQQVRSSRGMIYRVPYALLRLAARRLGPERTDIYKNEWLPELQYLLPDHEIRQFAACLRGTRYAVALYLVARSLADSDHYDWPQSGPPSADQNVE